ncbi:MULTISPECIES: hypothetical protein [unclassified Bradyrhizobium]|uniref:hypothetical protein n=1 Tax=unclassified Bradyrhizobium TaxID=2631580 RepID=UPI0028E75DE3|nr:MULTISPECIES: hypothetical protein [unclassified Bradyrhizobium]
MQLTPDTPIGLPSLNLSADEKATVVDLVCKAARAARSNVKPGTLEVPINIIVRKAMRTVKRTLGLTNLQIRGEHELEDMAKNDASLLGRIDISLQFLHQFGNEDAYVAIECKRVAAGKSDLNTKYVTEGVSRFINGKYSSGHEWGFMLGYVLALPVLEVTTAVDKRVRADYGESAKLSSVACHPEALAMLGGSLKQANGHVIRLAHIFVDMLPAA